MARKMTLVPSLVKPNNLMKSRKPKVFISELKCIDIPNIATARRINSLPCTQGLTQPNPLGFSFEWGAVVK